MSNTPPPSGLDHENAQLLKKHLHNLYLCVENISVLYEQFPELKTIQPRSFTQCFPDNLFGFAERLRFMNIEYAQRLNTSVVNPENPPFIPTGEQQDFINAVVKESVERCRHYNVDSFSELQNHVDANEILIQAWKEHINRKHYVASYADTKLCQYATDKAEAYLLDNKPVVNTIFGTDPTPLQKSIMAKGFQVIQTGGNCLAFQGNLPNGHIILITNDNSSLPADENDIILMGICETDFQPVSDPITVTLDQIPDVE